MTSKKGITLIVLVVTIIIALIIVSVSIVSVANTITNANLTSYKQELENLSQEVLRYYSLSGDLPKIDDTKYTIEQISNLVSDAETFTEELTKNNENSDSYFVKIDLSKLQFDRTSRGTLKDGTNGRDVFLVNYPSFNVYYADGYINRGSIYYSLANLNSNDKFKDENVSLDEIKFSGDLRVKKIKNSWSNKLNIEILTYMKTGETLNFTLPLANDNKTLAINTNSLKTNQIILETLEMIGYTSGDIESFNTLSAENKKATIKKQVGDVIVGSVEVDLSNYDSVAPTVSTNITESSYSEYNTYSFAVSDSLSGVKAIYYEYYTKVNNGNNIKYLDDSKYTQEYLLKNGKNEDITGDSVTLKIPKNVTAIKFIVSDKAGNITDIKDLNTKYPILIKYETVSGTNTSVTFNASVDASSYTLTSLSSAISVNGETYTALYNHGTSVNGFTYTDITGMGEYLFIKLVAVANGITETRIVKVATKDFTKEGTTVKSESSSYNPYIPNGFIHTIGNVRTGFVIQDISNTNNKYNEFVWIPVDYIIEQINLGNIVANSSTLNSIDDFITNWKIDNTVTKSTIDTNTISNLYSEPYLSDLSEYNNVINSIKAYGGFYVARYEAGSLESRTSSSSNTQVAIRKNVYPYNYIKLSNSISDTTGGAIELSRNMYSASSDIKSNLIYGIEWDAIMYFISIFNKNVSNSTSLGNYTGTSIMTGTNENYNAANIYDLAGNIEEWTMEGYNSITRVTRGGKTSINAAANRNYEYVVNVGYENVGFRPALYIVN